MVTSVIRAIRDVVAELEEGTIQPQVARTRLYALQTLLVAMRMHAESEAQPDPPALPGRTLELEAVASDAPEIPRENSANAHLFHLQTLTAAEPDRAKENQPCRL